MQALYNWPYEHPALFFSISSIGLLVVHLVGLRFKGVLMIIALILIVISFLFIALVYRPQPVPFAVMVALLFLYGSGLFVVLSELLLHGGGNFLTKKRGEKWTKELDYFYLSVGIVAILLSLNKISIVTERFEGTDIVAPFFLTTAIVFRFIKTRAEIGQWNKEHLSVCRRP
jgi:hypothetical protein